jgi:Zn-dependent protease with chaperone function
MRKRLAVALGLALFLVPMLWAQQASVDAELQSYIARQSAVWFSQETTRTGVVDPGAWKEPLESAFLRIANSSGQPGFSIQYAVLKDPSFNAACFPGGQFVVNAGTLLILDAVIQNQTGVALASIDAKKLALLREALVAPIIAHELSHYYCRHTFLSMKVQWAGASQAAGGESREMFDIRLLRFTQDNELEADRTGYLLLKRAGYTPDLMLGILSVMNELQQARLKEGGDSFNVYLETHPSPHARLAAFQGEQQKLNQWAADLEKAFSDVQLGINLDQALLTMEAGLQVVPSNLYLMKERALALHKQWLASVPLKDQKLRSIIDSPCFRDEMVFSSRGTRGVGKVIPGDRKLWTKARDAYAGIYDKTNDASFYSSFGVLLAYSPDANDEKAAAQLSLAAVQAVGSLENACNFATVLYLVGQKEKGVSLVGQIAKTFDDKYASLVSNSDDPAVNASLQQFHNRMAMSQAMNETYVSGNFTPLLNLALCLAYAGQKDTAKQVADAYLRGYESNSAWARYLATVSGAQIPRPAESSPKPVKGVTVGSPLPSVLETWGKATSVSQMKNGDEGWDYTALGAQLAIRDGVVYTISLSTADSPKVDDNFGIGSSRAEIEKIVGQPKRMADSYTVYEGPQNVAVLYAQDVARRIILFP